MSSKRKADSKPQANKRKPKKKVDDDFDSDNSDSIDGNGKIDGNGSSSGKDNVEVLIESSDGDEKLPEELLTTFDRDPGKLMIAGMVTWELTGRRDPKGKVTKVRPNLYVFHRFTDEKVSKGAINTNRTSLNSLLLNSFQFFFTVPLDCKRLQLSTQYSR